MTNKDLQTQLDREKFFRGHQNSTDNSGQMWYCEKCKKRVNEFKCAITHIERIETCACAKNAKKLQKKGA